ncbi:MAG TPA: MarR family transcriptional regulator [Methylomirabilota bacterium]|nr:MarR family transcriptional regulator [Methylomirabilota bacterium]
MYTTTRSDESLTDECAHEIIDVIPIIMRVIRSRLREHGAVEMSIPHFRTLTFVYNNDGASLSDVAEHIGLSLSAMSTLVDGLVSAGLMAREENREDRRRMTLSLTRRGRAKLDSAYKAARVQLAKSLHHLSPDECARIVTDLRILKSTFSNE